VVRIVLDINILVSASLKTSSAPSLIVRSVLSGQHEFVMSEEMMDKLDEVSRRPHLRVRMTEADRQEYLGLIRSKATFFAPDKSTIGQADDFEDDIVLGTAVAGEVDIIVTGDRGLLALHPFRGIAIVTARELLSLLDR
jgi:uncharacterized protein